MKMKIAIIIFIFVVSCSNSHVKELTISKANKLLEQDTNAVIINVDTPMEYSLSHIEGDINIDVLAMGFSDKVSMLEKTNKYIIYSKIKSRAISASDIMFKQGFSNVLVINATYSDTTSQIVK